MVDPGGSCVCRHLSIFFSFDVSDLSLVKTSDLDRRFASTKLPVVTWFDIRLFSLILTSTGGDFSDDISLDLH